MTGSARTVDAARPAATVTVAVCTFRRNDDLVATLEGIAPQAREVAADVDLLVVDNDPDAGARDVVASLGERLGVPARYVHEPRPGIAAARNRCLDEVTRDLLVFVDDDEHPRPGWLTRLLETRAATGAAAVAGPVVSEFETDLDPWITAGGFFVRQRWATGTARDICATNNLLLDRAALARTGLRFDERFGLTGGSDTVFSWLLNRAGERIVWCDEAVMVDRTPAERATRAWVLRRSRRFGNVYGRMAILYSTGPADRARARLRAAVDGLTRIVTGWAQVGIGVVTGSVRSQARGRRRASRGAGYLAAAVGRVQVEYARPGGRR